MNVSSEIVIGGLVISVEDKFCCEFRDVDGFNIFNMMKC